MEERGKIVMRKVEETRKKEKKKRGGGYTNRIQNPSNPPRTPNHHQRPLSQLAHYIPQNPQLSLRIHSYKRRQKNHLGLRPLRSHPYHITTILPLYFQRYILPLKLHASRNPQFRA